MRNCQLGGREEEEWAAREASKPSKLISIKSLCSLRKMEKGGGQSEYFPRGRREWPLYYSFHSVQPQFTNSAPIASGWTSLATPLYRCSNG